MLCSPQGTSLLTSVSKSLHRGYRHAAEAVGLRLREAANEGSEERAAAEEGLLSIRDALDVLDETIKVHPYVTTCQVVSIFMMVQIDTMQAAAICMHQRWHTGLAERSITQLLLTSCRSRSRMRPSCGLCTCMCWHTVLHAYHQAMWPGRTSSRRCMQSSATRHR